MNNDEQQAVLAAYKTAIARYQNATARGVQPTAGFCTCILGNDTEITETSIIDCLEHG